MKRIVTFLFVLLMTISMIACSSGGGGANTGDTPPPVNSAQGSETNTPTPSSEPKQEPEKAPESSAGQEQQPEKANEPAAGQEQQPEKAPDSANGQAQQPEKAPAQAAGQEQQPEKAPAPSTGQAQQPEAKPAPEPEAKPAPEQAAPAATAPAPAPTTPPAPAEVSPKGKKLLLVGRENAPDDLVAGEKLKALGFEVTYMIDRDFTAEETKGYDLIYISQTLNSKFIKGGVMKDVAIPTVYVKNHGMFYLGLSSIEENANVMNVKAIDIVDSQHKVAGGLSGTVDVYKETSDKIGISFGVPGKEAKVIATAPGDKGKAAIYYYDKGSKADNGYEVKARVSFFYLTNGNHENTTDAGWKLLENLVVWTLQNG